MAIRYDQDLLDDIRKTVKNYQAKRQRVLDKGGTVIPDPAYVANFLNDYTDRSQLIKDLKKLKRYSVRGAEEEIRFDSGEVRTRYELGELKRLVTQAKRNITLELKQQPEARLQQPIQQAHIKYLRDRYAYLSRPIGGLSSRQFKTYERIAHGEGDLQKKQKLFQDNFAYMLANVTYGMSNKVMDNLYKAFNKLSTSQLTKLLETDPYISSIIDYYEVLKAGAKIDNLENKIIELTDYFNQRANAI